MRKIILHIGYPKTGTSSIEVFLRDNCETLGRLGFHVPSLGQGRHGAHHAWARALAGLPAPPKQAVSLGEIVRELTEAPAGTVLVSSEKLTRVLANAKQAERLLGCLRSAEAEIIVVMYVRNQTQRLNSGYSQQVKSFRSRGDFEAHLQHVLANRASYGYAKWIDIAQRHGLELRARPFCEQVRSDGVVQDYLRTIGCPPCNSFSLPPRINESTGPFTVEAARRLQNWAVESFGELTWLQANRCKVALAQTISGLGIREPRYCGLNDEQAREIDAAFAQSNDSFARRMWGSDWHSVFQAELAHSFESNDYQHTDVPPAMREPLRAALATMRSEMSDILRRPRLAVREQWNRLHV